MYKLVEKNFKRSNPFERWSSKQTAWRRLCYTFKHFVNNIVFSFILGNYALTCVALYKITAYSM